MKRDVERPQAVVGRVRALCAIVAVLGALPAQGASWEAQLERALLAGEDTDAACSAARRAWLLAGQLEVGDAIAARKTVDEFVASRDPLHDQWTAAARRTAEAWLELARSYGKKRWYRAGHFLCVRSLAFDPQRAVERLGDNYLRRVERDAELSPWLHGSIDFAEGHPLRNRIGDLSGGYVVGGWKQVDGRLVAPPCLGPDPITGPAASQVWLSREVFEDAEFRFDIVFGEGEGSAIAGFLLGGQSPEEYTIIDIADGRGAPFVAVYDWNRSVERRSAAVIRLHHRQANRLVVRVQGEAVTVRVNGGKPLRTTVASSHGRIGFFVSGEDRHPAAHFGPLRIRTSDLGDDVSDSDLFLSTAHGLAESEDIEAEIWALRESFLGLHQSTKSLTADKLLQSCVQGMRAADPLQDDYEAVRRELALLWVDLGGKYLGNDMKESGRVAYEIAALFDPWQAIAGLKLVGPPPGDR